MKYNYKLKELENNKPLFYYFLGVIFTDGCIHVAKGRSSKTLTIDSKDLDWLENLKQFICPEIKIQKSRSCYRLPIYNTEFCNLLQKFGCTNKKSLTINYPIIPEEYKRDFIRGLMDGDGSIGIYQSRKNKYKYLKPQCYICSASRSFSYSLSQDLKDLEFKHSFVVQKNSNCMIENRVINSINHVYYIKFSTRLAAKLLSWIYYPGHIVSLNRKKNKAEEIISLYENKL